MAQTLGNNDEERNRIIMLVGEYIVNDGLSIRAIKKKLESDHNIKISIATISDYSKRYKKLLKDNGESIDNTFYENSKDKLIYHDGTVNLAVKQRVLESVKLYNEGYTIEQIADLMGVSYFVIYRDFTNRLPIIDQELANLIKEKMKNNSLSNLKNNKTPKK